MQTRIPTLETVSWRRCLMAAAVAFALLSMPAVPQTALAQSGPLNFGNNYFVTGDYVIAGVGLRGLGGSTGYATGTITMPDSNSVPVTGVPAGAQVIAAFLYWQTVESSQTTFAGQQGFFRPVYTGGPSTGYAITGTVLGNLNAPVSWSSGGCSGSSQGSKTIRTYRADVRPFLRVDSEGNVLAGNSLHPTQYEVRLADSGSNGGGAPLTLGATLVFIYRILDKSIPLNSIVIYDGSFAPSNSSSDMTQTIEGFYQAAASPIAKLTHIVGNGQPNKYENVYLDGVYLPSLYGVSSPPFPGNYNGSWDNPTWIVNNYGSAVQHDASDATTMVAPSASNSGCVSWGAVILSTTVKDSDNDGLLDVWEHNHGYCDAAVNNGSCGTTDPSWVSLPGSHEHTKDIYVQMDYMCSVVNPDGTCDTTHGNSFLPTSQVRTMMSNAFAPHGVDLHLIPTNAIQEQTCTDSTDSSGNPILCPFPNQPGVVGWKGGFALLKNQPLNYPDENSCEQALVGPCIRRFQHGRKDGYHYALFGRSLNAPSWSFGGGELTSVVASGTSVTFNTTTDPRFSSTNPTGVVPGDIVGGRGRVTVSDVVSNFNLNGTFYVTSATATGFTIQNPSLPGSPGAIYNLSTDPYLSVASGEAGTISGASDVGGEDSAITLGSWGADGQSANVQAGIFMHELGHTLALTHGGFYYDTAGSYVPTVEANCKPNFQSVMNYLFTVDLLGPGQTLDFSEQGLSTLNENSLPGGVTTTDGSATAYSTTKWYTPSAPGGVGTAATIHCDGTPILPADPQPTMYSVEGVVNPISPAWSSPQDITFNGSFDTSLRGYDDWANVDLRQIGAAGSLSTAGGPISRFSLGPISRFSLGPISRFSLGPGLGEITRATANAVTRTPRNLMANVLKSPISIRLSWMVPTFGQIGTYKIYRGVDGAPPAPPAYDMVAAPSTTYTDRNVSCGHTYSYFVTAVLAGTSQESVPSKTVTVSKCTVVH